MAEKDSEMKDYVPSPGQEGEERRDGGKTKKVHILHCSIVFTLEWVVEE